MSRPDDATTVREFSGDDVSRLDIRIGAGSVRLTADDRPGVSGTLEGPRVEDATIEQVGDTLRIATPRRVDGEHYLTIAIPVGIELRLGSGSADLEAEVDLAHAQIRTGSGAVSLRRVIDLDCTSGSGHIAAEQLDGSYARITTGSGDIVVGDCDASLRIRTASGDVGVTTLRSGLSGNTASGDVDVSATSGDVELRTASGDVRIGVADGLPAWLDLSTASGRVRVGLDGGEQPTGGEPYVRIRASTASGDITIDRA